MPQNKVRGRVGSSKGGRGLKADATGEAKAKLYITLPARKKDAPLLTVGVYRTKRIRLVLAL